MFNKKIQMNDLSQSYEMVIKGNYEIFEQDPHQFSFDARLSHIEHLNELYEMYMFFLDNEDYEKCALLMSHIELVKDDRLRM